MLRVAQRMFAGAAGRVRAGAQTGEAVIEVLLYCLSAFSCVCNSHLLERAQISKSSFGRGKTPPSSVVNYTLINAMR